MIKEGNENLQNIRYADDRTYIYRKGIVANLDNDNNDFNVLAHPTVRRDQDQINAIKNGIYNVRICTRNIATQEVTEQIINVYNNEKTVTLGKENKDDINNNQTDLNPNNYCRTYTFELVPGVDQDAVSNEISNSPDKYLPKAIIR